MRHALCERCFRDLTELLDPLHLHTELPLIQCCRCGRPTARGIYFYFEGPLPGALEETVRACFHLRGCNCAEIMAILADAGRTEDCPECRGTGWLTLFRNSDGSGDSWPEVCEPGCVFNHGHFERECESCLSGKVIAGESA